jgi:hypothetical protein
VAEAFVTHRELADVAQILDRLERTINRFLVVFGTALVILVVLVILILRRIGL